MVPEEKSTNEIVPNPSDALEFQTIKRGKPRRRGFRFFLLLVLVSSGAGLGWHFYGDQLMIHVDDQLPVIRAAEGPVKIRPETPGGLKIPDRDKLVYGRMNGSVTEPRIERLLPLPEIPKTPLAPSAKLNPETVQTMTRSNGIKSDFVSKQKLEKSKLKNGKANVSKETNIAEAPNNEKTLPKSSKVKVTKSRGTPLAPLSPPPVASPQSSDSPVSGIAYQIQIAAVRTPDRARSEWARLKSKHSDLLGDYSLNVVRVDLGPTKGIFYRLRAGPIAWEDVAKVLCENLSKRKVGCLIVRPGG